MKTIIVLLAHATVDQINATINQRDHRTPLHLACAIGNLAIAQLLIWVNRTLNNYIEMIIINTISNHQPSTEPCKHQADRP